MAARATWVLYWHGSCILTAAVQFIVPHMPSAQADFVPTILEHHAMTCGAVDSRVCAVAAVSDIVCTLVTGYAHSCLSRHEERV